MKKIVFAGISVLLTGCAMTYAPPSANYKAVSRAITANKQETLASAKRLLLLDGYQIQSFDDASGIISTSYVNKKVSPREADCGNTMGLDYLLDNRTKTQVAVNVIVEQDIVTVKANIQGEYKPGGADQDITLTCISTGAIERQIISNI